MSIKVLFLTPGLGKGGAEKQLFLLANHLNHKGYTVKIVSLIDRNMYDQELKQTNIPYKTLNFEQKSLISRFLAYKNLIIDFKPDIIISFMFAANFLSRLTKFFHKCIVISSIRNEIFGGKLSEKVLKYTNRLDAATVVNSDTVLNKLLAAGILDKRNAMSIPNVVNLPTYNFSEKIEARSEVRKRFNISSDQFVFLFVAHYRPQKDYDNLFKAISLMKENVKILMAGNLFESSWPYERVKELNIENKVILLGKTEELRELYLSADALVMSSKWEGLPNAILEAMSFELPVISTNVGGVKDLISDGHNGILCDSKNSLKLADSMKAVVNMPPERLKAMGAASRSHVASTFSYEVIMKKWDTLISSSLSK
ncbi:glycosyltransferase [uncultured Pontibacter sp.]|uniref:glycosyltransferase n=1 Tax=uncultured Pontibacter sp. TaxID=453356 RepID=UPI002626D81B|nr:glycosyltransferase [uncultured Pontibacter sp.]